MTNEPPSPASPSKEEGENENLPLKKPEADGALTATTHSPLLRNAVHLGVFVVFAIPLGTLADPLYGPRNGSLYAAGILLFIAIFNVVALPRFETGRRLSRPDESFFNGLWLYPLTLSICFLLYPAFAVVGGWAAMAAGDAAASIAGRTIRSPALPWNSKKTWAGLIGFICAAIGLCYVALYFCPCPLFMRRSGLPELPFVWTLSVLAAVSGAIVESLPSRLDDNVRVPLVSGAVLWISSIFLSWATRGLPKDTHVQPKQFLYALAINGVLAAGALLFKFADLPGTLLGAALGSIIFFFAQWQGYLLFILFAFGGSLLSKIGLKHKQTLGAAEARDGKRGFSNVAANLLVPGLSCLAYPVYGGHAAFLMAFAGALSAALADTASSEIGALSRAQPKLITTFKPVPHGTNGAVSALGFAAAIAACATIAGLAWSTDFYSLLLPAQQPSPLNVRILGSIVLVCAGMIGTVVDSYLGATIENRWPGVGKGAVNFACTLSGAIIAGVAWLV